MKARRIIRVITQSLLILTLISTALVPGILARYTSEDTDTDTARVAKWDITDAILTASAPITFSELAPSNSEYTGVKRTSTTSITKIAEVVNKCEVAVRLTFTAASTASLVPIDAAAEIPVGAENCFSINYYYESGGTYREFDFSEGVSLAIGEGFSLYATATWHSDEVSVTLSDSTVLSGDALDAYLGLNISGVAWDLAWYAEQVM